MSLPTGEIIDGKYRIIRMIGEGGMGAIYEGENVRIHRRVAIKVLHAAVASNADAVQRFEREAQAAGRIGSEHIVEVLDLGNLPDGDRYMVMEFLEGDTLSQRIHARTRLEPTDIQPIFNQVLEGLGAAHGAGIIHRDLKPDNVFLLRSKKGQGDYVKLLDFGISKFSALSGESGFSMTRTGSVMGTPYYMSPEQAKGAKAMDHRSDLYAVGVMLYEAVTGQVPFNADTFNELLFKIVLEEPPPLEQFVPNLDPAFAALVRKSMAREPGQRFQTAQEFQQALVDWMHPGGHQRVSGAVGTATPVHGAQPVFRNTGTPQVWSSSGSFQQSGHIPPAPKKTGLIVALAMVGMLVLGGGVLVAMKLRSSGAESAPTPDTAVADKAAAEAQQKAEADKAAAEKAAAEKAAAEKAEADKAAAEKSATEKTAAADGTQKPAAAGKPDSRTALTGARPSGARRTGAATPVKTGTQEPAKPPPTSTGTSTGRKIRTEL